MITPSRINAFLTVMEQQSPKEWSWKPDGSGLFWIIQYNVSRPPFQFLVEYNDELLYVQYVFQDFRVKPSCYLALYRVLLRLNEELSLVKFGLTAFDNLVLLGEIPSLQFNLDSFQSLLRLLVHCLEGLYWEISLIAESPGLAPYLAMQPADSITVPVVKRLSSTKL